MALSSETTDFFKRFAPKGQGEFSLPQEHQQDVPQAIHEFWGAHGLPLCGGGLVQFIDPAVFRDVAYSWLMGGNGRVITPLAITGFSELIYVRHLRETDMVPDGAERYDIRMLDPHFRAAGFLGWTLGEALARLDPAAPRNTDMIDFHPDFRPDLFKAAVAKEGPLAPNEAFHFAPALVMGGSEAIEHVAKGHAAVHLDILFQMT